MSHNSQPDACDLLIEIEKLDLIKEICDKHNHERVCEYLRACAGYLSYPEDIHVYRIIFNLYFKFKNYYHALRFALRLDDKKLVVRVMKAVDKNQYLKRQCALSFRIVFCVFFLKKVCKEIAKIRKHNAPRKTHKHKVQRKIK